MFPFLFDQKLNPQRSFARRLSMQKSYPICSSQRGPKDQPFPFLGGRKESKRPTFEILEKRIHVWYIDLHLPIKNQRFMQVDIPYI